MKIAGLILSLVGTLALISAPSVTAQPYPSRPVKFVVASTGSPQDVIGRLFA